MKTKKVTETQGAIKTVLPQNAIPENCCEAHGLGFQVLLTLTTNCFSISIFYEVFRLDAFT